MPRIFWTDRRLAALAALAAKGWSARRIAETLGRRWGEPLSAEAARKAAEKAGIRLLAKGGAPKGNRNAVGG